jgi:hypothetical protein
MPYRPKGVQASDDIVRASTPVDGRPIRFFGRQDSGCYQPVQACPDRLWIHPGFFRDLGHRLEAPFFAIPAGNMNQGQGFVRRQTAFPNLRVNENCGF